MEKKYIYLSYTLVEPFYILFLKYLSTDFGFIFLTTFL